MLVLVGQRRLGGREGDVKESQIASGGTHASGHVAQAGEFAQMPQKHRRKLGAGVDALGVLVGLVLVDLLGNQDAWNQMDRLAQNREILYLRFGHSINCFVAL